MWAVVGDGGQEPGAQWSCYLSKDKEVGRSTSSDSLWGGALSFSLVYLQHLAGSDT